MRKHIVVLAALLTAATTPSLAGEVFVSQIGGARQLAGSFKWPTAPGSAAKIAAPIKVNAFAAAAPNTLPPNANVSSVTQIGNEQLRNGRANRRKQSVRGRPAGFGKPGDR